MLRRHGLSTRAKRLALVAGYRCPYEPPREPRPEPHVDSDHSKELVGIDCFFVGRLHGSKGPIWQLTACDTCSSFAWAELVSRPESGPTVAQTTGLARRVAAELGRAGLRLERVLTDNGNEFGRRAFGGELRAMGIAHTQIRAGRPQSNGHVERLHRTILEECWRPAFARYLKVRFTGLKRDLATYLDYYNNERARTRAATHEAGLRPTSSTVLARWSRDEPRVSADLGGCSA